MGMGGPSTCLAARGFTHPPPCPVHCGIILFLGYAGSSYGLDIHLDNDASIEKAKEHERKGATRSISKGPEGGR